MIPKFRAWDSKRNEWLTDFYIGDNGKLYEKSKDTVYGVAVSVVTSDNVILMQSTGLKDKNGVEIFEGDIIVAMSQGVKVIGEVKRRIDGYWLMYPAWQHGELWHIVENVDTGETGVEVLGNIYENTELLEGESNG